MLRPLSEKQRQALRVICYALLFAFLIFFLITKFGTVKNTLDTIFSILLPFLIGAVFAFIVKPVTNYLDLKIGDFFVNKIYPKKIDLGLMTEKRARRKAAAISIVLSVILFFFIIVGIVMLVIPSLVNSIYVFKDQVPNIVEQANTLLWDWQETESDFGKLSYDVASRAWTELVNAYSQVVTDYTPKIPEFLASLIKYTLSFLVDVLVTIVSMVYILANRKRFAAQLDLITRSLFKKETADWLVKEAHFTDKKFSEFFSGKLLDSLIVGIILYIFFLIFNVPQALLIATFMAFCNMIPFFGPYLGSIPCGIIVLMSDLTHPINLLTFLVIVIVVQQLDGNILDPYIVGDNIGLSSFWVLFSVILFGDLFGFVGLLIGVPLFAVIYDIIRQLVYRGLTKRNEEVLITNYNFIYHDPSEEHSAQKKRSNEIKMRRAQQKKEAEEHAKANMERELVEAQALAEKRRQEESAKIQETNLTFEDIVETIFDETPSQEVSENNDSNIDSNK